MWFCPAARAEATASKTICVRLTGSDFISRDWSRRAKSSRSSTSEPIRLDSFSIRPISSFVFSSPVTAPWRWSSAKPRIAVIGVRSSCEASATKRRNLLSLSKRAAKDSSIRPNIVFSVPTKRPTSVFGFTSGRRAVRSPSAILSAVASTFASGLSPTIIILREASAIKKIMNKPISIKRPCRRARIRSISSNECAITTFPKPEGSVRKRTRKSCSSVSIVNGRSPFSEAFSGVIAVK